MRKLSVLHTITGDKKIKLLLTLFLLACILPSYRLAAKEWKGEWKTSKGKVLPYHIQIKDGQKATPVAVYLTNLKIKRIGTDTDKSILSDLANKGFMTVKLDCSAFFGNSSEIVQELTEFNTEMPQVLQNTIENKDLIQQGRIYYLPEGYNIDYNQSYWDRLDHGANGTAEHIVNMYNKYSVKKHKVPVVETVNEIKGKKGEALDHSLRMDVIYPTGKLNKSVPLMLTFSSSSERMITYVSTPHRAIYPLGFLLTGYVWAVAEHNYVTVAKDEYYGFIKGSYSLDKWNGLASSTAAIRFLRFNAGKYNFNGKIGAMGISKASYAVTRLADTEHEKLTEFAVFDGFKKGSPKPQPFPGVSSKIDVGYTAAGDGTDRYQYVTKTTVPLTMSAGKYDKFEKWDSFPKLLARCEKMNINYLPFWMEDIGHTYPVGKDFATGQDRYTLLKRFFDAHLYETKVLEVLYILPSDGNTKVFKDGKSFYLSPEVASPPNMEGLSVYAPISVRFTKSLASDAISSKNVKIVNLTSQKPLEGTWKASLKNTRFEFSPSAMLEPQTEYMITVMQDIKDINGTVLQKEIKSKFKTQ